jgi:hypothetical protein
MTVFEFIGQFFFQNNVFKLPEVFSELEIRVFLENKLGSFQAFLIYLFIYFFIHQQAIAQMII